MSVSSDFTVTGEMASSLMAYGERVAHLAKVQARHRAIARAEMREAIRKSNRAPDLKETRYLPTARAHAGQYFRSPFAHLPLAQRKVQMDKLGKVIVDTMLEDRTLSLTRACQAHKLNERLFYVWLKGPGLQYRHLVVGHANRRRGFVYHEIIVELMAGPLSEMFLGDAQTKFGAGKVRTMEGRTGMKFAGNRPRGL